MNTTSEALFDRHTWLATKALNAPIALLSLVDDQREFLKSATVPRAFRIGERQFPLSHSLAKHVVAAAQPLIVSDARVDAKLCDSLALRQFKVVAYAGVPLTTSAGRTLGVLAVIDTKPRAWSADDVRALRELAATIAIEIELRTAVGAEHHVRAVPHGLVDAVLRGEPVANEVSPGKRDAARLSRTIGSLRLLASLDELTGLQNRRGFMALAGHQMKLAERHSHPLLVFFADLDGLKQINDQLGHSEGDQALRDTAEVLRLTFRESDVLARLGGDEFAVLACQATLEDATRFEARLGAALRRLNAQPDRRFLLSISTGATVYDPNHPAPLETLLRHADAAMYEHKRYRASLRAAAP